MQVDILKMMGQIAGIGGIALGVFLILFRELIRKKIFPRLTREQSWRILLTFMILVWSVAVCGIAAWVIIQRGQGAASQVKGPATLTVSLWQVDLDTKGSLVASIEFPPAGGDVTKRLDDVVDWAAQTLHVPNPEEQTAVDIIIDIPADLANIQPSIQRSPPGPMTIMFWDTRNEKMRLPFSEDVVRQFTQAFHLEITVPGFDPHVVKISPGQAFQETFALIAGKVSIGIENFEGTDISGNAAERLSRHPGFKVVSPDMLATIRAEIRRHNATLASDPMMQMPLRKLSVDYILSGSVR